MARKKATSKKEIATVKPTDVPAFVQDEEDTGLANVQQYISPPRLKVVQSQSRKPFSELFNPGDLVVVPQMEVVSPIALNDRNKPADYGEPLLFTPLFFFVEWCLWNPLEIPGLNAIRDRTFNPDHEIALRAKNPQARSMPCPEDEDYDCKFCEHLNFLIRVHDNSTVGDTPCIATFARGEWRSGSNFLSLMNMRSGGRTPMYAMNFQGQVRFRSRNNNEWFGLDIANPEEGFGEPFVQTEEEYHQNREIYLQMKEAHEKLLIQVDYDDNEVVESNIDDM